MLDNNVRFNDDMQASLTFMQNTTAHIESYVYETPYPELNYEELVPVDTSANEWSTSVTFYSMDMVGAAAWISGNAKDVPVVGTSMEQFESGVHTAGIGYNYGFAEVNQARMLGQNLDASKASAARRVYTQKCYDVALIGDTEKGMNGLYNYPTVPKVAASAVGNENGATDSPLWVNKTADQIIADVNSVLTGIVTATKETELADTLLMPTERMLYISSTRLGDTAMTILEFIEKANVYTAQTGQKLRIRGKRGLTTVGDGGTARMIAFRRSPEVLKMHIPMAHRFFPVQIEGFQFTVPGMFRLGGLDWRLPKAGSYMDGI